VWYFVSASNALIRATMAAGHLGQIATPLQPTICPDVTWCADSGCYGATYVGDGPWWYWLASRTPEERARCVFATAPDVVGDATATHERSAPWLPRIRQLGYPVAYVAQDGLEPHAVPWADIDALFIGGTTTWKLGPQARTLVDAAVQRDKWVHMGRVNSERRMRYAQAIGCSSADGTYFTFGPSTNLPAVLAWVRATQWQTLEQATQDPTPLELPTPAP
jgi:hypothetical protein